MSRFALDERQSGRRTAFGDGGSLSASRTKRSNSVRIPVPEKYTAWISSPNQMKSLSLFASTKSMRPAGLPVDGEYMKGTSLARKDLASSKPTTCASHFGTRLPWSNLRGQVITGVPVRSPMRSS